MTLIGPVAAAPRVAAILHEQGGPLGLKDVDPGTANGQGLTLNGGPWYVMRPSGQPVVLNEQGQP